MAHHQGHLDTFLLTLCLLVIEISTVEKGIKTLEKLLLKILGVDIKYSLVKCNADIKQ